jgi:ribonuclease D
VTKVANGETDKRSKRARQILPAGAVYWEWDAEDEFEEQAGGQWLVLDPLRKWNRTVAYGWRWHPGELARLERLSAARDE